MLADTFTAMLERAARTRDDRSAVVWSDRDRSLTYAELHALAERAAAAFTSLGVGPGDRVGLLAHSGLDYLVASFGAWRMGAITAHIPVQVAGDLADVAGDCTPSVLVYTHDLFDAVDRARPHLTSITSYLCLDGPQPGAEGWDDVLAAAGTPPDHVVRPEDPCHLSFTSGSTGRPKGAVLRHGPTALAATCIAERLGLTAADSSLGPTSPASSYGLVANWLPGLHVGMPIGLRGRWDVAAVYDDLEANGVTYLPGNPIVLGDLLDESFRRGRPPAALRLVVSGGAPVPPALKAAWVEELGIAFSESYGQSELGGFVALGDPRSPDAARRGAVGPPLPDRPVAVLDGSGAEVPPGTPGEVCVGGGVMWGYWGLPERTAEVVHDGWLHTGDVGVIDDAGLLSTLGRWSERLTVDGETVFPRPMEEALRADELVRFAAVVLGCDASGAEAAVAAVTLHEAGAATASEVLARYRDRGGDPRLHAVELVDPMPMTATGKLDKVTLRRRFGT